MTTLETSLRGFRGQLIRPADVEYEQARWAWNKAIDRRPALIARCRCTADVVAAVRFGVRHGLELAVRGGGHSVPGHSTCEGGLVIDLGPMKGISVDAARRIAEVDPGVLWRELDGACEAVGLGVPGGEISDTGVAGLTLGGGIGWLSREYGLTCDNLIGVELVRADGSVVAVDDESDPELMWGLRGGGGNFGIVTRFKFRLNPVVTPMFGGMAMYPLDAAAEGLGVFFELADGAPDPLGLDAALITAPPEPFVPAAMHGKPALALAAAYNGPLAEGERLIAPLRTFTTPAVDEFGPIPYTALQSMIDPAIPPNVPSYARSEWLGDLDTNGIEQLVASAEAITSPISQVLIRVMGGAISRVAADATAFRFREARHMYAAISLWFDRDDPGEQHRAWTRASFERISPWSAGGGYVNHLDVDEGNQRVRQAYGTETWARLVALKRRFDPDNVFHLNQNVPPTG
jgi:FAD/FMN-containing dehydrogenase